MLSLLSCGIVEACVVVVALVATLAGLRQMLAPLTQLLPPLELAE